MARAKDAESRLRPSTPDVVAQPNHIDHFLATLTPAADVPLPDALIDNRDRVPHVEATMWQNAAHVEL